MRSTCGDPSSCWMPTKASRPGPMAPMVSPSTSTRAAVTRWIRASMHGSSTFAPRVVNATCRQTAPMFADATAALLHALAALVASLPWRWLYRAGDGIAAAWQALDARESRVAQRNLQLALPSLPAEERARLQREVLRTTARQALETLCFWTRSHARNLALITELQGNELFDAALASGRGVIVAAPHYGNWELLNQWLAMRTPLAILYRAPESPVGEAF